jgi:hypothetical protein
VDGLVCVGLELEYWDSVKDGLQASLDVDHNKYTLDDIKNALDAQKMQLWAIHDGALKCVFVTQISNYPNRRILECLALNGKHPKQWISFLLENMYDYAKENNCDYMETGGRKGWEKMFKQNQWDNLRIKMSRRIEYV